MHGIAVYEAVRKEPIQLVLVLYSIGHEQQLLEKPTIIERRQRHQYGADDQGKGDREFHFVAQVTDQ